MSERYKRNEPLPNIVEILPSDDLRSKHIKELILSMTAFRERDRPRMREVKKRIFIITEHDYERQQQLLPGEIDVDQYRINLYEDLGTGAYGRVCKAYNRQTCIVVAAKGIKIENSEVVDEAYNEARNMKAAIHTNIVQLFDIKTDSKHIWLFLEYGDCGDLEVYLQKQPSLSLIRKGDIIQQTASALSYLHQSKPPIIHRDVKPKNVVLKSVLGRDIAKLTDFGMAMIHQKMNFSSRSAMYSHVYETANLKGTPIFAAPEFFSEEADMQYTATVDVFSLGLMCAAMLDFGPDNQSFFPVSVESKKLGKGKIVGKEMVACHQKGLPMPHIVEITTEDDEIAKTIKELILQMTDFESDKRPRVWSVERQLLDMLKFD